jgi:hypothetical protein
MTDKGEPSVSTLQEVTQASEASYYFFGKLSGIRI